MEIKIKIQNYDDRQNMIRALANAGISAKVEEVRKSYKTNYYVVFETDKKRNNDLT